MAVTIMAQTQAFGVVTPLRARGYTVLPTPQQVDLEQGDIQLDGSWKISLQDVKADDIAAGTLAQGLREKTGFDLSAGQGAKVIRLAIKAGAVDPKLDQPRANQAYLLKVSDAGIEVTGNTSQGLFYGVQTLLQLIQRDPLGQWLLPRGSIRDWPAYELRICHWDTKHHQDRIETLKRYLDWCACFKINMICFELEDKFAYPSHPAIGQPGAFTPAQMQDLVNYGLARYIQIVPNIQAPAHMGFVLKHDEFKDLRSDGSNYMAKFSDPRTYELIFDMYKDVIEATKGVDYLHVSTDEVYYAGIDVEDQKVRPYNPENRSLWWAEYVRKARDFAAKFNRRIFVWVEYPLLPQHVEKLPADIIDGVVGNADYVSTEKKMGIRTVAYTPVQGAEWLFPNYFDWKDKKGETQPGRLKDAYDTPVYGRAAKVNPIGTFAAGWDDCGLHNETFWLGWVTVNAYGWHPAGASIPQTVTEFFEIYYGPGCEGLIDAYRDLEAGARLYEDSWDEVPSKERGPGYGSSQGKRKVNRMDETLRVPELPVLPSLAMDAESPIWKTRYIKRVDAARAELERNERLRLNLQAHMTRVRHNRYNVEVLLALAELQRHHIEMILAMARIEQDLLKASALAGRDKTQAVGLMVKAYEAADRVATDLDTTFAALKATWEKSMYPKNRTVDGKAYLHIMDDVKDHFADRRVDIDYMIAPEQRMKLPEFRDNLGKLIREYTNANSLDAKALPDKVLED
jgi:hexosaminidase